LLLLNIEADEVLFESGTQLPGVSSCPLESND
jgi:hypothetical protein